MAPVKGRALIAEPILPDVIFSRSVIFLVDDAKDDHLGFILNKPLGVNLGSVMPEFENYEFELFLGGPVSTESIHFFHEYGNLIHDSKHVKDNIYWGGNIQNVIEMLKADILDPQKIRFFLGYSGWSPGQLKDELKKDSWLVADVPDDFVFTAADNAWTDALSYVADKYNIWRNFPEDPELN